MDASESSIRSPDVKRTIREALAAGMDREEGMRQMRMLEWNQIECFKLLRDSLGISLGYAKIAVHSSEARADRRASNEALHEMMISVPTDVSDVEQVD